MRGRSRALSRRGVLAVLAVAGFVLSVVPGSPADAEAVGNTVDATLAYDPPGTSTIKFKAKNATSTNYPQFLDVRGDCGLSTRLPGTNTSVWALCDPGTSPWSMPNVGVDNAIGYSTDASNSTAITVTLGNVSLNGQGNPVIPQFATETFTCPGSEVHKVWFTGLTSYALSAVTVRVVAYYHLVCWGAADQGVHVAYMDLTVSNGTVSAANRKYTATEVASGPWTGDFAGYGVGAFRGQDNRIYSHRCHDHVDSGDQWSNVRCQIVRTRDAGTDIKWSEGDLRLSSSYEYLTSAGTWTSSKPASEKDVLELDIHTGQMNVVYDATLKRYVQTNIAADGFLDYRKLEIRTATSPEGPWTLAGRVSVPVCADGSGNQWYCYAGFVHSEYTIAGGGAGAPPATGRIGVSVFDRWQADGTPMLRLTRVPVCTEVPDQTFSFADVPTSSQFFTEISTVAGHCVAGAYSDENFSPATLLSRQGAVAWLYRAENAEYVRRTTPTFSDVPLTSTFFNEIEWAAANGIVTGYGDGTFHPTEDASRQRIASMLYEASGVTGYVPPAVQTFTDVDPDHDFYTEIEWGHSVGVIQGNSNGTFTPDGALSRQAAAAFVYRCYYDPLLGSPCVG